MEVNDVEDKVELHVSGRGQPFGAPGALAARASGAARENKPAKDSIGCALPCATRSSTFFVRSHVSSHHFFIMFHDTF